MPTYEYLCQECGERLEVFQKFTDKALRVHPECGGPLQKVFHASGVVFKGSGYYVTDSRSGKSQPAKKDAAAANGKSDSNGSKADKSEKSDKTDKSSENSGKSEKSDSKSTKSTAAAD